MNMKMWHAHEKGRANVRQSYNDYLVVTVFRTSSNHADILSGALRLLRKKFKPSTKFVKVSQKSPAMSTTSRKRSQAPSRPMACSYCRLKKIRCKFTWPKALGLPLAARNVTFLKFCCPWTGSGTHPCANCFVSPVVTALPLCIG